MEHTNQTKQKTVYLYLVAGLAAAVVATGSIMVAGSKPAKATPAYAAQTGNACGKCHVSAGGGGKLTSFGASWSKTKK